MIRRILVHGLCVVGVLWCLSMIALAPQAHMRLVNAGFLIAFVLAMLIFWQHPKEINRETE